MVGDVYIFVIFCDQITGCLMLGDGIKKSLTQEFDGHLFILVISLIPGVREPKRGGSLPGLSIAATPRIWKM